MPPPVKVASQRLGLVVLQPNSAGRPGLSGAGFGASMPTFSWWSRFAILPRVVLKIPKLGSINLHPSLLPRYRGAAPINWAIIRGEN